MASSRVVLRTSIYLTRLLLIGSALRDCGNAMLRDGRCHGDNWDRCSGVGMIKVDLGSRDGYKALVLLHVSLLVLFN